MRRTLLIITFGLLCGNIALAQELTVDVDAVKNLVNKWNDAHTIGTVENFSSLYSSTVNFYGSSLQRDRCISIKRELLNEQKDFSQTVSANLFLSGYSSGVIRCDFVKTVIHDGKAADYDAYLIIERIGGKYLIVGESDLTTDLNNDHAPDLGKTVAIKKLAPVLVSNADTKREDSATSRPLTGMFQLGIALLVGVVGLIFALRYYKKLKPSNRPQQIDKPERVDRKPERTVAQSKDHFEIGLAFEKFITKVFDSDKNYFSLLEWRSDKYHDGVFPASNRDPDLEYQYKAGDFVRRFAVECKYRSKSYTTIQLMDETRYKIYKLFHTNKMPVYIALGIGGKPEDPAELFLIPFQFVKPEMAYKEITKFRKTGKDGKTIKFFYDMHTDQLT